MQWSNEVWTAIIVAFFVGAVVGYLILLTTNANAKKQQKLELDLKAATEKMDEQKQQLEKHFEQSAQLLSTMAEDYQKLYTHLAQSSQALLAETSNKLEFFNQQLADTTTNTQTAEGKESEDSETVETTSSEDNSLQTDNKQNQPRDYTEGSSGLLKS